MVKVANLTADLVLQSARFEQGMKQAQRTSRETQQRITTAMHSSARSFDGLTRSTTSSTAVLGNFRSELAAVGAVAASALSFQKIVQYSDKWRQLEGRLRIVSSGMDEVATTQERLFDIAQGTRQPLEGVTNLYTRLNMALGESRRGMYDVAGIAETFSKALAVTGEGSAQAASAVLQFSQAVQSDFKASAQEINSLLDSAPRLALALQNSFGDGTKSLKELAEAGELSTDAVLRALEPMAAEARAISGEFDNMEVTVSQALTRLDNAFLRFVGNSEALSNGTSSLAEAITSLADNFDALAKIMLVIGGAAGARFVAQIAAGSIATARAAVASQAQASALNAATVAAAGNARMAAAMGKAHMAAAGSASASAIAVGNTGRAAVATTTAMTGATAAARALGASLLAFVGGPIGVAILGIAAGMYALQRDTEQTIDTMEKWDDIARKFKQNQEAMRTASGETRLAVVEDNKAMIASAIKQMEVYAKQLEQTVSMADKGVFGAFAVASQELWTSLGADGIRPSQAIKQFDAVQQALKEMRQAMEDAGAQAGKGVTPSSEDIEKARKSIEKMITSLREEAEILRLRDSMRGSNEAAIEREVRAYKIQNQVKETGIKLTKEQSAAIEEYLDSIEEITEKNARLEKSEKEREELAKRTKEAYDRLGMTFNSAFEDAIVEGEKLSDVLDSLLKDILRLSVRRSITEPLFAGLLGDGSGNGFLSGIVGSLFGGGTPSHATGIANVPYDMTARLHRGERVLTRQQADGMGNGGGMTVNIHNNAGAKVQATQRETAGGMQLDVMIDDAVAQNIGNPSSRTSRALNSMRNRTLTKR